MVSNQRSVEDGRQQQSWNGEREKFLPEQVKIVFIKAQNEVKMTGKNRVVLPALLALGLISTNANASDPCASVLCLYGKAVGQGGGSECRSAEKDF